jgi:signal transduction histidine kinase
VTQNRTNSFFEAEDSAINFIFLLMIIFNALVITDLFLSVLHSPAALILIRVMIMLIILGFLAANGLRHPEIRGRGWASLLIGFSLVFLSSLAELTAIAFQLSPFSRSALEVLENLVFNLLGYFCLAYGFFLWIPSILQARRRMEQTAAELEQKVRERTGSLEESNVQLSRSKARLEEANRLKNEFLASVSHELKTPLNSILGFCRLLIEERQGALNEKQLKSIRIIDSNSKSLLEQISKILDFAKLEFERVNLSLERVRPLDLFQELAAVLEPLTREKPVRIVIEPEGCPEEVVTDRKVLGQLMLGILDNALKFTGRGTVRVSSGLAADRASWWAAVSDTGQGIPEKDLPYIFDAFRQGDGSLSRRYGGTGLGLTIARKLANLLNGEISVQSTAGSGSTFTITLPLKTEDLEPAAAPGNGQQQKEE